MARLIETKLRPPPLRAERVTRPRLYTSLGSDDGRVVLVSAPPGFGKSTFVVEWLEAHERPYAWLSLDQYDNDAELLGEYLGAAVSRLVGHESGLKTVPGEGAPDVRSMISALVDDLGDAPAGSVLVLDDLHTVESTAVHEALGYLIDHLPDHVSLALVTRADPPLPLARLRSQDRLVDVRGADLRFNRGEIRTFFERQLGIDLSADEVDSLAERSEGWVAALQLVSLGAEAMDGRDLVTALSAEHDHISGYLIEEVLGRLSPELADFLVATSVLDRFDAELCRRIAGVDGAATMIEELDRANAFVIPLSGEGQGWYRYHHLFSELLRSRLRRTDPKREIDVLRAAADVCDERSLADDAIDYALRAGDLALAAAILDRHAVRQLALGRISRIRSWLHRFPVPAGPATGVVTLSWAWCRAFEGNLESARELIDRVEADHLQDFATDIRGQLEIMRAMVAFQAFDPAATERHARRGLELVERPSEYMECLAHLYIGRSLYARSEWDAARPHLQRSAELADRGNLFAAVTALFWLGACDGDTGDMVATERSMLRAREISAGAGADEELAPAAGIAEVGLAYVRLNQYEPDDAVAFAEHGTRLLERTTFAEMVFRAYFVWAEALSLGGRFGESDAIAQEGIEWLRGRAMGGGPLEAWLWLSQSRNFARQDRLADAAQVLEKLGRQGLGGSADVETVGFFEAAAALSLVIRRGDAAEARRLLAELPEGVPGYVPWVIERHVLEAAVHELHGESREATAALEAAIELATPSYRYQFSHAGPVVVRILGRIVGRTAHDDFVRSLLERLPWGAHGPSGNLIDPLTDREREVLAEIAAGYTNEQIADRLFISRGTVKRHTANIYMKLGVHHRAEAAAKGRELRLIE